MTRGSNFGDDKKGEIATLFELAMTGTVSKASFATT